jgi:hypothetical protein
MSAREVERYRSVMDAVDLIAVRRAATRRATTVTHDEPPMSGAEFQRNVRDDTDSWTDQMLASAERNGFHVERDWLREWLGDAMEAARKAKPPAINPGKANERDDRPADG